MFKFYYRGCYGSIRYRKRDGYFRGKIINLDSDTKDVVIYEEKSLKKLYDNFIKTVDFYYAIKKICEERTN